MLLTFDYDLIAPRVRGALKQEFPNETVALEPAYGRRVRIKLVSEKLNGHTEAEKQRIIRDVLRAEFPDAELQAISIVLAFGTDELA